MSKIQPYPKTRQEIAAYIKAATGRDVYEGYLYYNSQNQASFNHRNVGILKQFNDSGQIEEISDTENAYSPEEAMTNLFNRISDQWIAYNFLKPNGFTKIKPGGRIEKGELVNGEIVNIKTIDICR